MKMKRRIYGIILAASFLLGSLLLAQVPQGPRGHMQQKEAGSAPGRLHHGAGPRLEPSQALAIIGRYLELRSDQTEEIRVLLEGAREEARTVREELEPLAEALKAELSIEAPSAETVGSLMIQIDARRDLLREIRGETGEAIVAILTEEQREKVEAVYEAARLQRVAAAFKALRLLPPPAFERDAVE